MTTPYKDQRQEFFARYFNSGLDYSAFLQSGAAEHALKWEDSTKRVNLSSEQIELLSGFSRRMNILVLAGLWCGDCALVGGMLKIIAQTNPQILLRFQDNHANPELQDELRILGAQRVPVVVVLSEDFFEVLRFGDRQLSVYRRKAVSELGATCDAGILPPSGRELELELAEWIELIERAQLMLLLAPMLRRRHND